MIAYVQENLNPGEFDLFLDMVDPQPEPEREKPKRTRAPRTGLPPAAAAPAPKETQAEKEPVPLGLCSHKFEDDRECLAPASNTIHDKSFGYAGYHPFEPPKAVARAGRKSKPKPVDTTQTITSDDAIATAIAAGSGD